MDLKLTIEQLDKEIENLESSIGKLTETLKQKKKEKASFERLLNKANEIRK